MNPTAAHRPDPPATVPAATVPAAAPSTLTRQLPVRISALALVLQSVALIGVSSGLWLRTSPLLEDGDVLAAAPVLDMLLFVLIFLPLGMVGLAAALGLVMRRRPAWLFSMLIQAAVQGAALYFYFGLHTAYVVRTGIVYAIMASGIVVVLYLNSTDVRLAFRRTRASFPTTLVQEDVDEFAA